MSSPTCPSCGGTDHQGGTGLRHKLCFGGVDVLVETTDFICRGGTDHQGGTGLRHKLCFGGVDVLVETTDFICRGCGLEFKAARSGADGEWVVVPYVFNVKKKRLSSEQPKLTWK